MKVTASAPGKVILLGEYVVLEGASALVMAVNRRADVVICDSVPDACHVSAPQLGLPYAAFDPTDGGGIHWRDQPTAAWARFTPTAKLLETLLAQYRRVPDERRNFSLSLDTRGLFHTLAGGGLAKLGLGSSAAVSVALAAAVDGYFGPRAGNGGCWRDLDRLLALYRANQGGYGSGADLAASLYGGVIRYRLNGAGCDPRVRAVALPGDVGVLFVWSGRPVSTVSYLERFSRWRRSPHAARDNLINDMHAAAEAGVECAAARDAAGLLEAVRAYVDLLDRLGQAMGKDIVSGAHRAIGTIAARLGVAYKPCGAGGGDIGVALSEDPERLEEMAKRLGGVGFQTVPMAADHAGVRICSAG